MNEESPVAAAVLAARAGDQAGWDSLVERFVPLVVSVVRRHRLHGSDAEDVSQTVWLRLVEHLDDLREPQALPGWLVTTTRNECLRVITARKRSTPFDPTAREDLADPDEPGELDGDLLAAERHEALLAALAELPDHQRELLLVLMTDPPLSYTEVSQRLGIPVGSIGPTRARALARVRSCPAVAALMDTADDTAEAGAASAASSPGRAPSAHTAPAGSASSGGARVPRPAAAAGRSSRGGRRASGSALA